jgi:hypothetical protein
LSSRPPVNALGCRSIEDMLARLQSLPRASSELGNGGA